MCGLSLNAACPYGVHLLLLVKLLAIREPASISSYDLHKRWIAFYVSSN